MATCQHISVFQYCSLTDWHKTPPGLKRASLLIECKNSFYNLFGYRGRLQALQSNSDAPRQEDPSFIKALTKAPNASNMISLLTCLRRPVDCAGAFSSNLASSWVAMDFTLFWFPIAASILLSVRALTRVGLSSRQLLEVSSYKSVASMD